MNITLDRVRAEVAGLKAWVVSQFWTKAQVSGWTITNFYRMASHQSTSKGAASARMPIILDATGKIDSSFITQTAIAEYIADTVGAMVTGNTETGIAVTYQDGDNTLDFDAQTAGDARYLQGHGVFSVGGGVDTMRYQADVATLTDVQGLRVDVTFVSANIRSFSTHCDIVLQRNGNTADHCIAVFNALWSSQGSGSTAALRVWDATAGMSGTPTEISVTAITNGIRMTLNSTDFGASGGLDTNMLVVETIGTNASILTHTVTVF